MSRIRFAVRGRVVVGLAAALFGVGCVPVQVEAVGPPPDGISADVAYEVAPPFDDIETYPTVVYEGAPVYYVGGVWYRHDSRGWGRYHREPQELSRQRSQHDRDPRWVQAGERHPEQGSRPGAAERQPVVEHRSQESPRQGVTDRQPAQVRPATVPTAQPQQRKKVQPAQSVPVPRGKGPVRGHPAPGPEHR